MPINKKHKTTGENKLDDFELGCIGTVASFLAILALISISLGVELLAYVIPMALICIILFRIRRIDNNRYLAMIILVSSVVFILGLLIPSNAFVRTPIADIVRFFSILAGVPIFVYSICCLLINRAKRIISYPIFILLLILFDCGAIYLLS